LSGPTALAPGTEIGQRYKVVELLGQGGMGAVYRCRDEELRRDVALKVIKPEIAADLSVLDRFRREIQLSSRVTHKNVLRVYDLGEAGGVRFLTMQYIEGENLSNLIKKTGALQTPRLVALFRQVCEGLEAAHEEGVVHRDLKPQNVLLDAEDHVWLTDFGLAKNLGGTAMTEKGVVMGTPSYMSPEQVRGQAVDKRSDIYSLGIVFYEMATGRTPFEGGSMFEVMMRRLSTPPQPVTELNPAVPAYLRKILERCLAVDPAARYQSVGEILSDLDSAKFHTTVRYEIQHRRRVLLAAAACLAAVLGVAGVAWLVKRKPAATAAAGPARSVLIADFENKTGEPVFDGVLEQAVSIGLEGAPFISAFSRVQARKVAAEIRPGSTALGLETARLVARREGVAIVVTGGIKRAGPGYGVEVAALDGVSGKLLGDHSLSVSEKNRVLAAIGELVVLTRRDLGDVIPDSVRAVAAETFTAGSLEAARSYAEAQDLMAVGKWREAVPVYQNALKLDPTFGRAFAGLAVCYLNLNQTEEARKYYEKAFSLIDRMTDREKYRTRGGYYLLTRNYAKAAEEYRALVEKYPSDPAGPTNLAFAYFYARDMRRAVEIGRLAVEAHPANVLTRGNLALYAMYAGDFTTAAREAETVLAANPGYETAYVAAAMARLDAGDVEGARGFSERLRGVSPYGASIAATGLADLALFQGRSNEAIDLLQKGIPGDTAAGFPAEAARKETIISEVLLSRGEARPAVAAVDRALALSKRHYILLSAGRTLAGAGEEKRARQLATTLASQIEAEPRSFAKLIEGEVLLRRNQAREAAARFREAGEILDTWLGRYLLGRAYLEAGAFTEAHAELEICLKRRGEATSIFLDDVPSYHVLPPVYYYLGRAQEGLGSAGAAESYRRFVELRAQADDDPLVLDARRRLERR
jgi:tetratricopeptide (TPR) repeat protein/predicted Ser/Thr protein kinase